MLILHSRLLRNSYNRMDKSSPASHPVPVTPSQGKQTAYLFGVVSVDLCNGKMQSQTEVSTQHAQQHSKSPYLDLYSTRISLWQVPGEEQRQANKSVQKCKQKTWSERTWTWRFFVLFWLTFQTIRSAEPFHSLSLLVKFENFES